MFKLKFPPEVKTMRARAVYEHRKGSVSKRPSVWLSQRKHLEAFLRRLSGDSSQPGRKGRRGKDTERDKVGRRPRAVK